jgi:hypothetical protein
MIALLPQTGQRHLSANGVADAGNLAPAGNPNPSRVGGKKKQGFVAVFTKLEYLILNQIRQPPADQ